MASRLCGNRLSLRNQYDTKNPARECLYGRPQSDRRYRQGWLQPCPDPVGATPDSPVDPRVTKNPQGGFEMSVENFAKNGCKKFLGAPELPLNSRSAYAAEVQAKVALGNGARKPSWRTGSRNTLGFRRAGTFVLLARFVRPRYRR
jgi:hypothetical protein